MNRNSRKLPESIEVELTNSTVSIPVNRKKIKNIILKVSANRTVTVSAPLRTSIELIRKFVLPKSAWIEKQLSKKSELNNIFGGLKSDSMTELFGEKYHIVIKHGAKSVSKTSDTIIITTPDVTNIDLTNAIFEKWWRALAISTFDDITNRLMPIFSGLSVLIPRIAVRRMTSRWGSCVKANNKITLNEYLLKTDMRFIEYVVLHELTHLIYSGHGKDFYAFIATHMPDWKERARSYR